MYRRRYEQQCALAYHLTALLALWLAIAVPVACHHATPQPMFLVAARDHGTHAHTSHAHDHAASGDALPAPVDDEDCPTFLAHPHVPSTADSLAVPVAVLPLDALAAAPYRVQPIVPATSLTPRSPPVPHDDPPPRPTLLAAGA